MTISAYQIDNLIKTYKKKSKVIIRIDTMSASFPNRYTDVVTLSGDEGLTADIYKKICSNLFEILKKE